MDNGRKVILYHSPQTRSSGSLILLEELGAPYELHALNMKAGEQRRPAYLAINPIAKVPALIDRSLKREPAPPQGSSYGDDNTMLDTLTAELAKGPYLLGEPFSAAGCAVGRSPEMDHQVEAGSRAPRSRRLSAASWQPAGGSQSRSHGRGAAESP